MDVAAVVVGDKAFDAHHHVLSALEAVRRRIPGLQAAQHEAMALTLGGAAVRDVDPAVLAEAGVEGQAEQALFDVHGRHVARVVRLRQQPALAVEHADAALALEHEHATASVARTGDGGRELQAVVQHLDDPDAVTRCGRRRGGFRAAGRERGQQEQGDRLQVHRIVLRTIR